MHGIIDSILKAIIAVINTLGYWGIAGGMMIESACIPLPSELVLPLAGFMAAGGRISILGANIAVAVGSLIGSIIAYIVGYYGGRPFILKYGKYFFVSEGHFYKAEKTFNRYGVAAVFFGRLLPVIRTFISLPAGISRMNLPKFLLFSLMGMLPWNALLIWLGFKFGENVDAIIGPIYHKIEYVIIALLVLAVLAFIFKSLRDRKHLPEKVN